MNLWAENLTKRLMKPTMTKQLKDAKSRLIFQRCFNRRIRAVLTFTQPEILPAPMFVEFRRAAVFHLASPKSFDRETFEAAIARKISAQAMIAAPDVKLVWETKSENDYTWRELKLPMLGWNVNYALTGNELIVANDTDFLRETLSEPHSPQIEKQNLMPFTSLSVINFGERENAYDKIFYELNRQKQADDFFTDNLTSLFDAASQLKKIEIKENHQKMCLTKR